MKRKVDQEETQRAYVHALSDSGSHIREKERRPGRTPKRFATAEHLHCSSCGFSIASTRAYPFADLRANGMPELGL